MTFNQETQVQYCEEEGNLPTMKFNFVSIDQLESHQPNSTVGMYYSRCWLNIDYIFGGPHNFLWGLVEFRQHDVIPPNS